MNFNRRDFLKTVGNGIGFLLTSLPHIGWRSGVKATEKLTNDFYQNFLHPPVEARPFFRWWWNGNRIQADEITRQMTLIQQAGAGGVEINPIALDSIVKNPTGKAIPWLSHEWNQLVKHTVTQGKALHLIVDLIVGTGWPFGGRFLQPTETIQGIELEVKSITGPTIHQENLSVANTPDHRLLQLKLFPKPLTDMNNGNDLLKNVDEKGRVEFEVPAGIHELYILTWRNKFREVLFGAPGADGPVLDHFNRQVVLKYLNRLSEALMPVVGEKLGDHLRAMFCDSIELEGANWTTDFPIEFEKRRGYSIEPYLPLILNFEIEVAEELKDILKRVRYDYAKTLAELFMERFIQSFQEWCHQNGLKSRYQAYGHPWLYTDLLDGYLVPDIPESDQWLFNRGWIDYAEIDAIRYAIWNKYAASAAHLTDRKIVSCEAMTNTRGLFQASLEYLKQATDINIITGVNHLVLHGFNYSPPEAGFPGWIRFGTYFSEHNPWWPYLRLWMDYAARLFSTFQESRPTASVAILGPTLDVWSENGLDRNPWIKTPWYLHGLWQAFNHHGFLADYINATILEQAQFKNGEIHFGPMQYRILFVANVSTLTPATAQAILDYAKNQGTVIFIGTTPNRFPGLIEKEKNDQLVQQAIQTALTKFPDSVKTVEAPSKNELISWAGRLMKLTPIKPVVSISAPDEKLFFNHHLKGEQEIFFFANLDRQRERRFLARFPTGDKTPWQWHPESGKREVFPYQNVKNELHLQLDPLESLLLIFESAHHSAPSNLPAPDLKKFITIKGPWQVAFQPVQGQPFSQTFPELKDFSQIPELRSFAGTATYSTEFEVPTTTRMLLDLGKVAEIAEVTLNNRPLGVKWWGRRRYQINEELKPGKNRLEIKVTTLLFNYCQSLTDNVVCQHWVQRNQRQEALPAGLIGPVRLYY